MCFIQNKGIVLSSGSHSLKAGILKVKKKQEFKFLWLLFLYIIIVQI